MAKQIIINHARHEIRVALVEGGVVSELFYEREKKKSVVGNIYKGKVLKVLPGMESAFVDIGLEKAGFLYVDDIRVIDSNENGETEEHTGGRRKVRQDINSLIKEGQDIMVQVSKGPIGTKGARITCNITLPGRNLVFMPHVNNVGVSRQIRDDKERIRLRKIVSNVKPEGTGFIVRTVAAGRSEEEFKHDVSYLISTWENVEKKFKTYRSPAVVYEDLNLTFRTIRDMLSPDVEALVIDDAHEYEKIKNYLTSYLPRYSSMVKQFTRKTGIFDYFGITQEIDKALSRKVWLKSGGSLIIDQTEALTAVDVNTGSFIGKKSHEDTIRTTNLEAVIEIVHQLKLRDIGGIIIIDFIDMELVENRQTVYQCLKDELKRDKARTKVLPISEIGLVEMTRKRNRENLGRYLRSACHYCDGTARIRSPATMIYDIYREIIRLTNSPYAPHSLLLGLHPDVADYLENEEMETYRSMERLVKGSISLQTSDRYHHEQYELFEL
ncbi:MAG: ribonuclease E/G [SAR324 cluster bacterium]|uniref:Ribonuclease E/G n=1 Tax=SAR324 cluster bacterium TaxID=2024889 RepID=A0A2A4TAU3_9DELT|nr:MAG: ribonuclease E/G [SAR324 cluster bacterium]